MKVGGIYTQARGGDGADIDAGGFGKQARRAG